MYVRVVVEFDESVTTWSAVAGQLHDAGATDVLPLRIEIAEYVVAYFPSDRSVDSLLIALMGITGVIDASKDEWRISSKNI